MEDYSNGIKETKELKRRVRDVIDPGRDLGHVDGKKKSVASTTESSNFSTTGRETPQTEYSENQTETTKRPESVHGDTEAPTDGPRPQALKPSGTQEERKFTPMDVDTAPTVGPDGLKRNPDGTICEDCN